MLRLMQWWAYWRENAECAKKGFNLAILVTTLILILLGFLVVPLGLSVDPAVSVYLERLAAIIFFVWGFVWLPYSRHQALVAEIETYKEMARPKLRLICNKCISACSVTNTIGTFHFFRVVVQSSEGYQGITGCFGNLVGIEKNGGVIRDHETDVLPFAPSEAGDSTNKTILPGLSYHLDVLAVHLGANIVYLAGKGGNLSRPLAKNGAPVIDAPVEYFLTIKICGTGIPTQTGQLRFVWTRDYRSSELELI